MLVTGASGFVGRQFLRALDYSANDVHAAVRQPQAKLHRGVTWHFKDLRDPLQAIDLVNTLRPHTLVHLAWCTESGSFYSDPANFDWLRSSLAMLEAFIANDGSRLMIAGTCAEYGWHGDACIEGVTPLLPATLYGECKKALFEAATAAAQRGGLNLVWPRLFFLYGPFEHRSRFVPSIIMDLLTQRPAVCEQGALRRDYMLVSDAGEILARLLYSEYQGPVNVGTGVAPKLGDIARALSMLMGQVARLSIVDDPPDSAVDSVVRADVRCLRDTMPNWSPTSLSDGLSRTVAWWRNEANH